MTRLFALLTSTALLAAPAMAFDVKTMSEDEKAAFGEAVRAYLLDNPEVIMEAVSVLEQRQQADAAAQDLQLLADNAEALKNDPNSWVGGNPDGDITVIEFLDYKCGYCKKAWTEVEELVKTDGNIRFVIKEFPILGDQSVLAARFAIAVRRVAGDEAYSRAHDALMNLRGDVTEESLAALATELGLDAAAIAKGMNDPEVEAIIAANHALGTTLQINGTPSFVIDETMVRGYVPLDGMRQIVEDQRKG